MNKFNLEMKAMYTANCKILMEEIEKDTNGIILFVQESEK